MSNCFIKQTAHDYDLEINIVESIYKKYGDYPIVFYEKLEEEIKINTTGGMK